MCIVKCVLSPTVYLVSVDLLPPEMHGLQGDKKVKYQSQRNMAAEFEQLPCSLHFTTGNSA